MKSEVHMLESGWPLLLRGLWPSAVLRLLQIRGLARLCVICCMMARLPHARVMQVLSQSQQQAMVKDDTRINFVINAASGLVALLRHQPAGGRCSTNAVILQKTCFHFPKWHLEQILLTALRDTLGVTMSLHYLRSELIL